MNQNHCNHGFEVLEACNAIFPLKFTVLWQITSKCNGVLHVFTGDIADVFEDSGILSSCASEDVDVLKNEVGLFHFVFFFFVVVVIYVDLFQGHNSPFHFS